MISSFHSTRVIKCQHQFQFVVYCEHWNSAFRLFFFSSSCSNLSFLIKNSYALLKFMWNYVFRVRRGFHQTHLKERFILFPDFPLNFRKRLTCKNSNLAVCATNAHDIFSSQSSSCSSFFFAFGKRRNLHASVWTMAWWVTTPERGVHQRDNELYSWIKISARDKSRIV